MASKIPANLQEDVRLRAKFLCEYCHAHEIWQHIPFTIDHLIPVIAGGTDGFDNLALACFHCNRRKSDRQSAIDPLTGETVLLFNPRQHQWSEHFVWSVDGLLIVPLTAVGRATCELLEFNRERVIRIRRADIEVKRHPPADDPIQLTPTE
ncbi:MAG: HNH endonuclease [Acidobacteria bacterium]|nr:HNH endonuclease [Acidobacteriota bacterium]